MTIWQLFKSKIINEDQKEIILKDSFQQTLLGLNLKLSEHELHSLVDLVETDDEQIDVESLIMIMEKYGIKEWPKSSKPKEKKPQIDVKRKATTISDLSANSLKVMCLLTDYLLNSDTSVYEYFDG